tara:strand:+ start:661 stop:930 length:270 start_codon:yes stop_codon:yes gene_type:complete
MKGFKSLKKKGCYGMLVFIRTVRNVIWDENLETEVFEYSDKMKPGFILEISDYFEDYYLIRFFDGEKAYHWGVDLFQKIEENNLTYLQK